MMGGVITLDVMVCDVMLVRSLWLTVFLSGIRLTGIPQRLPFDTHRLCLDLTQRLLGRTSEIALIETFSLASLHEPITRKPIYVTRRKQKSIKENGVEGSGLEDPDDDLPPLEDTAEQ